MSWGRKNSLDEIKPIKKTASFTMLFATPQSTLTPSQKEIIQDYFYYIEKFLNSFFNSLVKNKDKKVLLPTAGVILSLAISHQIDLEKFETEVNKFYGKLANIPSALLAIYKLTQGSIPDDNSLAMFIPDARISLLKNKLALFKATGDYLASLISEWLKQKMAREEIDIDRCVNLYLKANVGHKTPSPQQQ